MRHTYTQMHISQISEYRIHHTWPTCGNVGNSAGWRALAATLSRGFAAVLIFHGNPIGAITKLPRSILVLRPSFRDMSDKKYE